MMGYIHNVFNPACHTCDCDANIAVFWRGEEGGGGRSISRWRLIYLHRSPSRRRLSFQVPLLIEVCQRHFMPLSPARNKKTDRQIGLNDKRNVVQIVQIDKNAEQTLQEISFTMVSDFNRKIHPIFISLSKSSGIFVGRLFPWFGPSHFLNRIRLRSTAQLVYIDYASLFFSLSHTHTHKLVR